MIDASMERPTVRDLRRKLALEPYDRLDLGDLPQRAFTPTFELAAPDWPDFMVTDVADWPSRQRDVNASLLRGPHGVISAAADVALVVAFTGTLPPVPATLDVQLLSHSTSGHWDGHLRCAAIRLELSDAGITLGNELAARWHSTRAALGWSPMEELLEYRALLRQHGVDCNESYRHFAEGAYPIDLDDQALEVLSTDGPALLDQMSPDDLSSACLMILAPNSSVN